MTEKNDVPGIDEPDFSALRVVLVQPTHPGNIGATARAMKTMGLLQLVLVAPKYFPHPEATARASGAESVLEQALVVETLEEALAPCHFVIGTSARARSLPWPLQTPPECAQQVLQEMSRGPVAIVFGQERSGLSNDELQCCHAHVTIPSSAHYSSLNLAAAVQILCYELRMQWLAQQPSERVAPLAAAEGVIPEATAGEMEGFFQHLEQTLTRIRFLNPAHPRLLMRRLRRLYTRTRPDQQELNILRGVLSATQQAIGKTEKLEKS